MLPSYVGARTTIQRDPAADPACRSLFVSKAKGADDPLNALYVAINRQSFDENNKHSMSTRQGLGYVKIGYLSANDPAFLENLRAAVEAGKIAEIEVGHIAGPKVLNWIVRMRDAAPKTQAMRMTGRFSMKDLMATREAQIGGRKSAFDIHTSSPLDHARQIWTQANIEQFDRAVDELGIREACLKIFKVTDLRRCGTMRFEFKSNDRGSIIWKSGSPI